MGETQEDNEEPLAFGGMANSDNSYVSSVSVWDETAALNLVKQRHDRLKLLLESFCEHIPNHLGNLFGAIQEHNFSKVLYLAHTIKGSAGQMKASQLEQSSAAMEQAAKDKDIANIEALHPTLINNAEAVLACFKEWLALRNR